METTRLGRTGLMVTRTAFGVLPIPPTQKPERIPIFTSAYEAGINFYDTARAYTDSEEKLGAALADVRENIIIATKSGASTKSGVLADLETSLHNLRTDYVDILQLHNPKTLPDPNDPESAYAALLTAQKQGKIRHIGITNHSLETALAAVDSNLYETMQFPLCSISSEEDLALIQRCVEKDMGVIAMKALSGGLLTNARAAFAFLRQYEHVVPIWGIQRMEELKEFIELDTNPPRMDNAVRAQIERDKQELQGNFCRACGYCLPCPAEIPIPMAARIGLLLRRMPVERFLEKDWQQKMARIRNCLDCGQCRERCPYNLDPPKLLRASLEEYEAFVEKKSR